MSSYECGTDDGANGNDPAKWRKWCRGYCYKGKFFVLKPATATDTVSSLARSISSCGCVIQAASRHSGGDAALFVPELFINGSSSWNVIPSLMRITESTPDMLHFPEVADEWKPAIRIAHVVSGNNSGRTVRGRNYQL
ncbi:hypothetical protein [Paraburkholderia fungorum]